ncbi:MAG: DUF2100 domain-containing protein [Promethearchaeota archaeon]
MNVQETQVKLTKIINEIIEVKSTLSREIPVVDIRDIKHNVLPGLENVLESIKDLIFKIEKKKQFPDELTTGIELDSNIIERLNRSLFIVARKDIYKKIKGIQRIRVESILTGGPIIAEDYKIMNPHIPEQAMDGIKRKVEKIIAQVIKASENKDLIVLVGEEGNKVDILLLKSMTMLKEKTGKEVISFKIETNDNKPVVLENKILKFIQDLEMAP